MHKQLNKVFSKICLTAFLVQFTQLACNGELITAEVIGVSDGDTIKVRTRDNRTLTIRLNGIDAPEKSQAFGSAAKQFASNSCFGKTVQLNTFDKDRYNRIIADVKLPNGELLNDELVKAGLAWWYRKYAPANQILMSHEEKARSEHIGLWQDKNPVAPWDFRANRHYASNKPDQKELPHGSPEVRIKLKETKPLEGKVEDSKINPLTGRVSDKQKESGVMKIVQYRTGSLQALPPRQSLAPSNYAQNDFSPVPLQKTLPAAVTATHPPLRAESESSRPLRGAAKKSPQRQAEESAPVRKNPDSEHAPKREDLLASAPQRTLEDTAPKREIQPSTPDYNPSWVPRQDYAQLPDQAESYASLPRVNSNVSGNANLPPARRPKAANMAAKLQAKNNEKDQKSERNQRLEELLWDKWYQQVNEMLCPQLENRLKAHGSPAGSNRVQITVTKEHSLSARLVQASNKDFDEAVLESYQALNGNSKLSFPKGTKRTVLEFESAHIQPVTGPTSKFDSQAIKGDREWIRH